MTDKKTSLRNKLNQNRIELESLLTSLSPEQWQTPVFEEGDTWTVLTVASHLTENERGMSIHIHKTRQGKETVPEGFNVHEWNAGVKGRIGAPAPAELLQMMAQTRARTLEGLESIKDEEWGLTGRHPTQGLITIEQYFETIANHDLEHLAQIKRALGVG
ncbi:MAG: DinB family protein [Anaerolineae bacterium]